MIRPKVLKMPMHGPRFAMWVAATRYLHLEVFYNFFASRCRSVDWSVGEMHFASYHGSWVRTPQGEGRTTRAKSDNALLFWFAPSRWCSQQVGIKSLRGLPPKIWLMNFSFYPAQSSAVTFMVGWEHWGGAAQFLVFYFFRWPSRESAGFRLDLAINRDMGE